MLSFSNGVHAALRIAVGASLLGLGFRYAAQARLGFENASYPMCMCSTHMTVQEWAQVGIVLVTGFWILLGVRTRVISSFMLVFFGVHAVFCCISNGGFSADHFVSLSLIVALAGLTVTGGGGTALYRRGWADLLG